MKNQLTLVDAQGEWIARHETRYSDNTMKNYLSMFRRLNTSIGRNLILTNVTTSHIDNWLAAYPHGPTANHNLSKIKTFFTWCLRMGYLKRNPCDPLDTRRVQKTSRQTKHRVPVSEWPALLNAAEARHPLDRAVVACGLYLGSRSSELRAVTISDLQYDDTGQLVRIQITRTKQHWTTTVPVVLELAEEIEAWVTVYARSIGRIPPPNAYLLPAKATTTTRNEQGQWATTGDHNLQPFKQLHPSNHIQMVASALKEVGYYQAGEGTHTLRRSVAAALYEEEIDAGYSQALDLVRTYLGHSQTSTTEKYIGTSYSEQRLDDRLEGRQMFQQEATSDNVVPIKGREPQ